MQDEKPVRRTPAPLFVVLLILTSLGISIWTYNRFPHHTILHINDMWRVHLVGENDIHAIKISSGRLQIIRQDSANLWLEGTGNILWHEHTIKVFRADLYLDTHRLSKGAGKPIVNILFYPDGRVQKGAYSMVADKPDQ